jgi:hypothetical protein
MAIGNICLYKQSRFGIEQTLLEPADNMMRYTAGITETSNQEGKFSPPKGCWNC